MVLCELPVPEFLCTWLAIPGRPTIGITLGQGPTALAVGAVGVV